MGSTKLMNLVKWVQNIENGVDKVDEFGKMGTKY